MSNLDHEELRRLLQSRSSRAPFRASAEIGAQSQHAAMRQIRQESIRSLEDELQKAGIDVRRLRVALARNRERSRQAFAALQPGIPLSLPSRPGATSNRLRSLRPLAGRSILLDQPRTVSFLNEPLFFSQYGLTGPTPVSIAPNNVFFRPQVVHDGPPNGDVGSLAYSSWVFWYVWNNESDSSMIITVSTAMDLTGYVEARAVDNDWPCMPATVRSTLSSEIGLGSLDEPGIETQDFIIADMHAEAHTPFEDVEDRSFNHESHYLSIDSYLVLPNFTLVITVGLSFETQFGWYDSEGVYNHGIADFLSQSREITCSSVVVVATPVQIF